MAKISKIKKSKDVPSGRAISIQQPFVEEILRGIKKFEFRSRGTKIRGRVYLYASQKVREDGNWRRIKLDQDSVPRGLIVGSVEILDCVYFEDKGYYGYKLSKPKRYKKYLKPDNHPQPCFFFPFGPIRNARKERSGKKRQQYRGPVRPMPALAAIVGEEKRTRKQILRSIERYIVKNKLTLPGNRLLIRPDRKLIYISAGKSPFSIYELPNFITANTKK